MDKINARLETYLGINDSELGKLELNSCPDGKRVSDIDFHEPVKALIPKPQRLAR